MQLAFLPAAVLYDLTMLYGFIALDKLEDFFVDI